MRLMAVSKFFQISRCVAIISELFLKNDTKCIFLVNINHNFDLPVVFHNTEREVIDYRNWVLKPDVYLANLNGISLKNFFRRIGNTSNYNPKAKFLFLMDNRTTETEYELSRYFTSKAFFFPSNCESSSYAEMALLLKDNNLLSIDEVDTSLQENLTSSQEQQKQWNNSELKVCFLDETVPPYSLYTLCPNCKSTGGLSFDVVDMILDRLKINRFDQQLSGSEFSTNSLKNWLSSGKCDIIFSPLIMDDSLLDFIFPVNDDELIWFVPSPAKISKWRYLIRVFPVEVWVIWGIALVVVISVWLILEKIEIHMNEVKLEVQEIVFNEKINIIGILKKVWYLFLYKNVVISKLFLEQSYRFNIKNLFQAALIVTVVLTTFTMNLIYKTRYTSLLLGPDIYEEAIKTMEDIVDNQLFVSFAEWRLPAFDGTSSKVRNYFKTHNTECETIPTCIERMNKFGDLALLMSIENVKYDYEKYLDKDGRTIIEPIYPRFVKPLYGTISVRGHPFVRILSEGIDRLRDHGFLALIISKYSSKYRKSELSEDKKLSFDQLKGPFVILIFGISVGIILFILEVSLNYLKNNH